MLVADHSGRMCIVSSCGWESSTLQLCNTAMIRAMFSRFVVHIYYVFCVVLELNWLLWSAKIINEPDFIAEKTCHCWLLCSTWTELAIMAHPGLLFSWHSVIYDHSNAYPILEELNTEDVGHFIFSMRFALQWMCLTMSLEAFATVWNSPFEYTASSNICGFIITCPSSIIAEQDFWLSHW